MKKIFIIGILTALIFTATGCSSGYNYQVFDTTYSFNKAQVKMPDGSVISGNVDSWRDYEDSDQLQVVIDGVTYLSAAENIVLIAEPVSEDR